jgi:hypothetical protein
MPRRDSLFSPRFDNSCLSIATFLLACMARVNQAIDDFHCSTVSVTKTKSIEPELSTLGDVDVELYRLVPT